jgi:hypothetical protein
VLGVFGFFCAFNEVVNKNGNTATCSEAYLTVFKVPIESLYWEGRVGF